MKRLNGTLCALLLFVSFAFTGSASAQVVSPAAPSTEHQALSTQIAPTEAPGTTNAITPVAGTTHIFADVLTNSLGDFRRMSSKPSLAWFGIGAAAALIGHSMDHPVTSGMSSAVLEDPFEAGDFLGGWRMQLGGALTTYTLGHITGQQRLAEVGANLLRAQLVAKVITVGLKTAVNRERPDGTPYSFPSGHASASFASATVLQREFGWKVGVPAYGLATYIAASRIQAQRHFLSDVAFGAAIGIAAGHSITIGHGEHRFAVAPVATPGGAAISFSLVGTH